jgi:hypothetical protein
MMPIEHSNYRHSVFHVDLPFHFFYRCGIIICWKLTAATAESSTNHLPTIAGLSSSRHTSLVIPVIGDSNAYHHKDLPAYGWSSGLQPKQHCFCKSVGKLQKPPISGSIMKRCKVWDLNWHSHGIEACERSQLLGGWMKWTQLDMSCMLKVPKYHVSLLYLYVIAVLELVGQLRSDCGEQKRLILANLGLGRSDVCPRLPNAVRSSRSRCPHPVNLQSSAWAWWRLLTTWLLSKCELMSKINYRAYER